MDRFKKYISQRKRAVAFFVLGVGLASAFLFNYSLTAPFVSLNRDIRLLALENITDFNSLNPRIKILTFDDKSVGILKYPELRVRDWNFLVEKMTAVGVSKIIIDKKFGFFSEDEQKSLSGFASRVKISNRVNAGIALHSRVLPAVERLELTERKGFDISKLVKDQEVVEKIPLLDKSAYGAPLILRSAFANLGYMNIEPNLFVYPVVRLSGGMFLPYLGTLAADSIHINKSGLYLNNHLVPRYDDGSIGFRVIAPDFLHKKSISIGGLFSALAKGMEIGKVFQKGDIVVVLPSMFTGNTDMENTVLGYISRGFLLVSYINSVLNGDWVHFSKWLDFCLTVFFMALILFLLTGRSSLIFYSAVLLTLVASSVLSFVIYEKALFDVNWSLILFLPITLGVLEHVLLNRRKDMENMNLKMSLRNALPEHTVNELLQSPEKLLADPKEAILTMMFIDIACFSLYTERTDPVKALKYLTEVLERMTQIVHEHGGFVDKSLGDGMLCVFGHQFTGEERSEGQADQAISCAIALQKMNVASISNSSDGFAPLPLRIGINTGKVYVGNLGGKRRTDFTVIGKSVNFAQRLESACEQHRILLSHSTYELSHVEAEHGIPVQKRLIQIKHHEELLEAIEINPFRADEEKMVFDVDRSFRDFFAMNRKDDRWSADIVAKMLVRSEFGSSLAVDFSDSGACLLLDRYLATGVRISFTIDSENGALAKELAKHGLSRLDAVVKWGKKKEEKYLHGVYFDRLNSMQKDILRATVEHVIVPMPLTST